MKKVIYKFAASAAMVMCAARGAQAAVAAGEGQEQSAQASRSRVDDINWWKELVVTAAFVDVDAETVTLRGLHFGTKAPTVFCETYKMTVLSFSDTEVVVLPGVPVEPAQHPESKRVDEDDVERAGPPEPEAA